MASSVPHKILNIKNAQVTLDGETYGAAITNANISVVQNDVEWLPISGEDQYDVEKPVYTLNLDLGQDTTTGSLYAALVTRAGEQVTFEVAPRDGGTAKAAGSVTLKHPSQYLGPRGVATATAALRINGEPTFTWDAAPVEP